MIINTNMHRSFLPYLYTGFCVICAMIGHSSYASTDAMSYYQSDYKNTKCDEYIRNNYNIYKDELSKISASYFNKDLKSILEVVEGSDYVLYVKNLSDCSSSYKYVGDANYFRSAHAYSLLLIDIVGNPNRKYKEPSQRVNELVEDIVDDIDKILLSRKINK